MIDCLDITVFVTIALLFIVWRKRSSRNVRRSTLRFEGKLRDFSVLGKTPRKRAVVVGINYYNTDSELQGCVADAKSIAKRLYEKGFREIKMLIDDPSYNGLKPTGQNIREAMDWLVADVQEGDVLWFSQSSHGSQFRDWFESIVAGMGNLIGFAQGDLADQNDSNRECIIPVDYNLDKLSTLIFGDEIHARLIAPLNNTGAKINILIDACHAGIGIGEQPYRYSHISKSECAKVGKRSLTNKYCTYEDPMFAHNKLNVNVLYIGSCRDSELSEDMTDDSGTNHYGACSKAFLSATNRQSISYVQLFDGMYGWMNQNAIIDQHPQFASSKLIMLDEPFTF